LRQFSFLEMKEVPYSACIVSWFPITSATLMTSLSTRHDVTDTVPEFPGLLGDRAQGAEADRQNIHQGRAFNHLLFSDSISNFPEAEQIDERNKYDKSSQKTASHSRVLCVLPHDQAGSDPHHQAHSNVIETAEQAGFPAHDAAAFHPVLHPTIERIRHLALSAQK